MKRKQTYNTAEGFTLIELLVVLGIISLLSSIIIVSVHDARRKARDARRMGDMEQLNKAIQQYTIDKGHAPYINDPTNCSAAGYMVGANCVAVDFDSTWISLGVDLAPYVKTMPHDPCGVKCSAPSVAPWYTYVYAAPAAMATRCYAAPPCLAGQGELDNMYQLYAETLERTGRSWGVNESIFSSF